MVTATLKRGTDGGSTGGLIWPNSAVQKRIMIEFMRACALKIAL
jgi:hypothetical protein